MMENIKWTTWVVPERFVWKYISLIVLVLYALPYLFGLRLTMFGFLLNLLWADFMFFSWYKAKIKSEKYFKDYERWKKWREDNGEDEDEDKNN